MGYGATDGDELIGAVRIGLGAGVDEVGARLHAFVTDPIGIGTADIVVRQGDFWERDEAARCGAVLTQRASKADERDELIRGRCVAGLPRCPIADVIIWGEAGRVERGRLGARGLIGASGDEPGGRKIGQVGAPDAGPHRIADGGSGGVGLGDVRSGGGAAVRAGLLLKVREGEAHRDDRVQFGARRELLVHDGARLDRDKGGKGDQQHDDSCHHRQGQDEAETGATLAVFHAVPPGWWYEYYYSFFESGKCHLWPPLGPIAGKVTR